MAWYGSHIDTTKKLDQLIDQTPSLHQLLNYPQFIQQLKSFNPKLLDYLTNSSSITSQLITYISTPPSQTDSQQRKYKLPTLSMQMIQSQAMSIINSFFKQDPKRKLKYFNIMFDEVLKSGNKVDGQIVPLLAGYFLRVNICLLNNKYKDAIDCMYQNGKNFEKLLENCQSLSITNTLQVYLNLDLTKNSSTIPQRLTIKLNIISHIMKIIDQSIQRQKTLSTSPSTLQQPNQTYLNNMRVQNLSSVLIQLLQKYYLIADGKQMVDQILTQQAYIKVFYKNIFDQKSQISMALINILISIIKYYSFSSFNTEEWSNLEQNKKNQERLEEQFAIAFLLEAMPNLIYELNRCQKFTLYYAKIVELINTTIALNSHKIFNCVKNCKYLQTLIELLFRFENCSILGMMIEKVFLIIFRSQRLINQEIKHYIFCEAKIIDLTAARYLNTFQSDEQVSASMGFAFRRKAYFGHLMKLMKIYSGIQTTDQDIINAIKNKSQIWNKISRLILKPYEAINIKQLGTYQNIPEISANQHSVKTMQGSNGFSNSRRQLDNNKLIDQINRQEAIQNLKTLETNLAPENKIQAENLYHPHKEEYSEGSGKSTNNDDEFFSPPTENVIQKLPYPPVFTEKKSSESSSKSEKDSQKSINQNLRNSPTLEKKSSSYSDFLQKQKQKAGDQIRKQRSRSKEKALSKGKTKITSPSPSKRVNKWAQGGDQKQQQKQKISLTSPNNNVANKVPPISTQPKNLPKIPMHKKGLNLSSNNNTNSNNDNSPKDRQDIHNKSMQLQKKQQMQSVTNQISKSKSMMNLQQLKKVKILYQFDIPTKRQFRKITQEDKAIFDMLGISY